MHRTKLLKTGITLLGGLLLFIAGPAGAGEIASGRALYLEYCATCHGITGNGDGPMARALTTPPPDLRRLGERYGNPLPEDQIARFIDGRADVAAHGPRDMPVWGLRFSPEAQGNQRLIKRVIAALVAYLQSIQTGAHVASRE
jgi:mono/diheme cytochrome c family protein